jgi:hypothetical protein
MKKSILLVAVFGFILFFTSCSKPPEVTVSKYFEAMKMKDKDTMAAMALDPNALDFKEYEIVSISEPVETEFALPRLKTKAAELGKKKQTQGGVYMDAVDVVDDLKFQLEETRRRAKKQELEKQIQEAEETVKAEKQKILDIQLEINNINDEIKKEENLAKMSTGITKNLDMYVGKTHTQQTEVKVTLNNGDIKTYIFKLRKDVLNMPEAKPRNGRLVILKIATPEELEAEKTQPKAPANTEEVTEKTPEAEGNQKEEPKTEDEGNK